MGENTHQNCTRQNKNKEDPGRQQPCWGFLFCTKLTQPTGNLDQKNAEDIMRLLERINGQGTTVLVVSHNQELVRSMHRRQVVLRRGQVARDLAREAAAYGY